MPKTKKLVFMALLTAMALGIFMLEAQLPSLLPIPGVKLGLANIVTLAAMLLMGKKEAGTVLLLRVIMGSMFAGSPSTLIFSAAGGLLAYLSMCLSLPAWKNRLWLTGALSAVAHNLGQLLAGAAVLGTWGIFAYAPVLLVSGLATGLFTGFASKYLTEALMKMRN